MLQLSVGIAPEGDRSKGYAVAAVGGPGRAGGTGPRGPGPPAGSGPGPGWVRAGPGPGWGSGRVRVGSGPGPGRFRARSGPGPGPGGVRARAGCVAPPKEDLAVPSGGQRRPRRRRGLMGKKGQEEWRRVFFSFFNRHRSCCMQP